MKAPNKIYIDGFSAFCTVPVKNGIEYIRKDVLLEWAENWGKYKLRTDDGFLYAMELLVQHLNSV